MKKIGVISDIHGNLAALEKALSYLRQQACEEIIHTGDVVSIGANSRECLEMLLQNNVLCLLGNHDKDFAENNFVHKTFSHVSTEHKKFVFDSMRDYRDVVAKFPLFTERTCGGKKIVFEHYCRLPVPAPNGYIFCELTDNHPDETGFDKMYSHYDCDVAFFGHKHESCDKRGKRLYVDVGSVGCHPQPAANGIVIAYDNVNFSYRRFSLPYDMRATELAMAQIPDGKYLFDFYFLHKKNLQKEF